MIVSCRHYVSMMTEAREGPLPAHKRLALRFHHRVCPVCNLYTKGFDQTVELLRELPPEPAPDALRAALPPPGCGRAETEG